MAIVMVLSAWGVPALASQARERALYNVGVQVQQDLRSLQQYAITTRVPRSVTFSTGTGSYVLDFKGGTRTRTLQKYVVLSLSACPATLWFDEFGRPCSKAGSTYTLLNVDAHIVFTNGAGDKQVTVSVGHVLGRSSLNWTIR